MTAHQLGHDAAAAHQRAAMAPHAATARDRAQHFDARVRGGGDLVDGGTIA
jgi:hypothetical protein